MNDVGISLNLPQWAVVVLLTYLSIVIVVRLVGTDRTARWKVQEVTLGFGGCDDAPNAR